MTTPEIHTDPVTGIQFRTTPDGWEMRGVLGGFADPREGWREAGPHVVAAALRVFGPPLPEKPRVVTLDGENIAGSYQSPFTYRNDQWYDADGDRVYKSESLHRALVTLDRVQNGSADGAGDDE